MVRTTPEYEQRITDIDEQGDGLSKREIAFIAEAVDAPAHIVLTEHGKLLIDMLYHYRVDKRAGVLGD